MPKLFSLSVLMVLLFGILPLAQAQDPAAPVRQLKPTACRFDAPVWQRVECYDLIVPKDRSNPDSPNLRLHVAVFQSSNPSAANNDNPSNFFSIMNPLTSSSFR